jgi:Phosphatidylinositol 3- and 4-kinase.
MTDGKITHDVHIQCIDEYRPVFRGKNGTVEKNFRDTYKFNIAAYRLDKLLNLNMVPVSVERQVDGKPCAVTWWVDDVKMSEEDRRDKQIKPPASQFWVDQLNKVRVFDQLIYNTDRNQGNLLITSDWRLWMIDHTRAFRTARTLLKPDALIRCDYALLTAMRKLNSAILTKELVPYIRPEEVSALLARRDLIVHYFDTQVKAKGDDAVLTGIPRSTPVVSIP